MLLRLRNWWERPPRMHQVVSSHFARSKQRLSKWYPQLACLAFGIKEIVWRTSRQARLFCHWKRHLTGILRFGVVDRRWICDVYPSWWPSRILHFWLNYKRFFNHRKFFVNILLLVLHIVCNLNHNQFRVGYNNKNFEMSFRTPSSLSRWSVNNIIRVKVIVLVVL